MQSNQFLDLREFRPAQAQFLADHPQNFPLPRVHAGTDHGRLDLQLDESARQSRVKMTELAKPA